MGLNKQIRFVHQDKPEPGELIAPVAVFDEDGNPVTPGSGSVTPAVKVDKLPAGADAAAIVTWGNQLIDSLTEAGLMAGDRPAAKTIRSVAVKRATA